MKKDTGTGIRPRLAMLISRLSSSIKGTHFIRTLSDEMNWNEKTSTRRIRKEWETALSSASTEEELQQIQAEIGVQKVSAQYVVFDKDRAKEWVKARSGGWYGIKADMDIDEVFNLPCARLVDLCEYAQPRNLKFTYAKFCNMSAEERSGWGIFSFSPEDVRSTKRNPGKKGSVVLLVDMQKFALKYEAFLEGIG